MTTTGHPIGDAVLPAAVQLVGAVRSGDPVEITEAIDWAYQLAGQHPHWTTALMLVLAGMVPDDKRVSQLLAWSEQGVA